MPLDPEAVSLYPLSVEDALAALVRTPPPTKTAKLATAKRRASKKQKRRPPSS